MADFGLSGTVQDYLVCDAVCCTLETGRHGDISLRTHRIRTLQDLDKAYLKVDRISGTPGSRAEFVTVILGRMMQDGERHSKRRERNINR